MEVREGNHQDIPGILKVLKASLGETSSKKTEEVWRFKHIDNPFGESLVLIALENNEVIGVRAFMRWQWQRGEEVYSAFRAVDTATHPDHQGKGIFKKLTLKALEIGKERGDNFVFNTPNSQSKPGYLKMGWEEVDNLKVSIRPVNPFLWKRKNGGYQYPKEWNESGAPEFLDSYHLKKINSNQLFTPKSLEYLQWRYINNPLQDYHVHATPDYFLAGYVKDQGKFKELRISEALKSPGLPKKILRKEVRRWAKKYGVQVISFSPESDLDFTLTISGKFGPVLTFRDMALPKEEKQNFLNLGTWAYSTGDLELF